VYANRLRQPLQLELSEGLELEAATVASEEPHHVGGKNLAAVAAGAQAGGLDDRDAVEVAAFRLDLTDSQSDAHRQGFRRGRTGTYGLLHPDGTGQTGGYAPEGHHEPVPGALDLVTSGIRDDGP
jgi:hypothetical protein